MQLGLCGEGGRFVREKDRLRVEDLATLGRGMVYEADRSVAGMPEKARRLPDIRDVLAMDFVDELASIDHCRTIPSR
jgi:hypothetical protein